MPRRCRRGRDHVIKRRSHQELILQPQHAGGGLERHDGTVDHDAPGNARNLRDQLLVDCAEIRAASSPRARRSTTRPRAIARGLRAR